MFDIEEIMRNIPHRYPFLLIDKIIDFKKNKSVTVLKNITINEAQFQGHFPNKPIFPGVYIIENMAQSVALHTGYQFFLLNYLVTDATLNVDVISIFALFLLVPTHKLRINS